MSIRNMPCIFTKKFVFISFVMQFFLINSVKELPKNMTDNVYHTDYLKQLKNLYSKKIYSLVQCSLGSICPKVEFEYNKNDTLLINNIYSFLTQNIEKSVLSYLDKNCFEKLRIIDNLKYVYLYSGHTINDLSTKSQCEKMNEGYFFFILKFKLGDEIFESNTEYLNMIKFLKVKNFYYGGCFAQNCQTLISQTFNETANKKLYDYTKTNKINMLRIKTKYLSESKNSNNRIPYIFTICFISFFFLRLLITIIGMIYYYCDEDPKKELGMQNSEETYRQSMDDDGDEYDEEEKENSMILHQEEKKVIVENNKNWIYKIHRILTFSKNVKYFFTIKNCLYDDSNIEVLSGVRIFFFFGYTLNENFYSLVQIPNKYLNDHSPFTSLTMIFIRYSSYSLVGILFLDGIIFSFKLYSYIKKYGISIKNLLIFQFSFVSRILVFYVIFFFFFVSFYSIQNFFGTDKNYRFLFSSNIKQRTCYNSPYLTLIPFYTPYLCVNQNLYFCIKFVLFYMIELYTSFLLVILIYLCSKIRSKIFDIIISLLILFSCFFAYFNNKKNADDLVDISVVFGDLGSFFRLYSICFTYFLGHLVGLGYFYYCDIIAEDSIVMHNKNCYIYFRFCYWLMVKIDQMNIVLKSIISILCLSIPFLMGSIFTIKQKALSSTNQSLRFKVGNLQLFVYMYEYHIFSLSLVFIMLLLLMRGRGSSFLRYIFVSDLFIIYSRVSIICMFLTESFVYLFYSLTGIQYYMSFGMVFLITIGLFNMIFVSAIIFSFMLEIPFRILYRDFSKKYKIKP